MKVIAVIHNVTHPCVMCGPEYDKVEWIIVVTIVHTKHNVDVGSDYYRIKSCYDKNDYRITINLFKGYII